MSATTFQVNEAANQRIGIAVSITAHVVILVLCYFFVNWSPPDPPLPDYGVELNFGVDPEGFGDLQTLAPANDSKNAQDAKPNDITKMSEPEPQPEVAEAQPAPVAEDEPDVTTGHTQELDSPVEVPEKKPEKVAKPVEKPVVRTETKPTPAPTYTPDKQEEGGRGVKGTSSEMAGNNNGDRPGKVGDQGDRRGTINAKGLYGSPGKGGGSSLDMAGWVWDKRPDQTDVSNEEGRIVFKIKVDENGDLTQVRVIEKTVSPSVVAFYQKQIEELTFSKTRDNVASASESEGTITVIVRSN